MTGSQWFYFFNHANFLSNIPPHITAEELLNAYKLINLKEFDSFEQIAYCEHVRGNYSLTFESLLDGLRESLKYWPLDQTEKKDKPDDLSLFWSCNLRTKRMMQTIQENLARYQDSCLIPRNYKKKFLLLSYDKESIEMSELNFCLHILSFCAGFEDGMAIRTMLSKGESLNKAIETVCDLYTSTTEIHKIFSSPE